jgi:hypothetical protein
MSSLQFPFDVLPRTGAAASLPAPAVILDQDRKPLTKKEVSADHPTWCPGCGDFSVLALYFKLIERRKIWHEKITTVAGIGCSSRFPYFVQAHGANYIHGRALPFATGVSLSRPDLHVFVFTTTSARAFTHLKINARQLLSLRRRRRGGWRAAPTALVIPASDILCRRLLWGSTTPLLQELCRSISVHSI